MARPAHLPDYDNPPINEVVLGIQFATPSGYQQIYAGEVWSLFKNKFPEVEEQPPLPPTFETFGLPQKGQLNFGIITGASHDRFWFLSEKKEQLIQFQNDRFLHNWRKIGEDKNPYPHFEEIIESFENELQSLTKYFSKFSSDPLNVNQCELTYINHILLTKETSDKVEDWIKLINLLDTSPEDVSLGYRKVIKDTNGKPYGRLICEGSTGINKRNESIFVLNITVRGIPQESNTASALNFLKEGREKIVNCFDEITTDFAHKQWRKK